jgi:hypothetical protein
LIDTDCAGCCTIYHSITTTPLLEKELYCKHKHIYCWHNTSLSTLQTKSKYPRLGNSRSLTFVYEISKVRKLKRVIFFNLYFKWDTIKFRLRRIIIRLICQEVINTLPVTSWITHVASHWQTLSNNVVLSTSRHERSSNSQL